VTIDRVHLENSLLWPYSSLVKPIGTSVIPMSWYVSVVQTDKTAMIEEQWLCHREQLRRKYCFIRKFF
jgi:hypothetical protein